MSTSTMTDIKKQPKARSALHDGLNHALNREVTTFLRYMVQSSLLKGVEWAPLREMYEEEVQDEMGHAKYLSDKIVMLGGQPRLEPDLTSPPINPKDMLRADIAEELVDVKTYRQLAELAQKEGMIELRLKLEDIAGDEQRHAEQMQRLLG